MSKIILITGAAGFIGSRTAQILLDQKYKTVAIDNLNDYYDIRIKKFRLSLLKQDKNFIFYEGDIEDKPFLTEIFKKHSISTVINLAARAGVRYSITNPFIYASTNYYGSLNLLDMMRENNISKYVMASTSSIYAGSKMPYKEESSVNQPISPYAASKKAAELIAYTYHHQFNIDVSIVRYFTVYGPSGRPDMSVLRFIKWIDEEKPIILYGDGSQSRDFTYIDDIARGTIAASEKDVGYEIINLGGGKNPISINTLIAKIELLLNKYAIINQKPFHSADVDSTWADITKAKNILDWEPIISLDKGLEKTVSWYMKNKSWLKDINFI
ncbi:MAG: nucleotide sugar epimerase [Crocinitomicaceae bacterium]|nr:nucleotide sugar epimerase [Crocinitomicaceae bacterium]|tara:strand:- start:807 stop:1787 length:981 start_codon:yes stop_codon:yes gene_type:complete